MKTRLFIFSFVLSLLSGSLGATVSKEYRLPGAFSQMKGGVKVSILPQIELISIIQKISNYSEKHGFLLTNETAGYVAEVNEYFGSYKTDPVVRMFDKLSRPGMLNYSIPSSIMLHVDADLNLRKDILLDDFVVNRCGGRDSLAIFLDLLRQFAARSSFNTFFQQHKKYYLSLTDTTVAHLDRQNHITEIENFYGVKQRSYNIVLVSLYNYVGYGNSLLYPDGKRDIFNVMGPMKYQNGMPFFGDEEYLRYIVSHEFSHPFINPLTEKNWAYIKAYAPNFDAIPAVAKKQVCGDWQECINEFVIRAITTCLAENVSDSFGKKIYDKEKSMGVSYLDALRDKIKYYQSNRDKYPTFASYYLSILDTFKDVR
jgi:hypothetical protein